MRTLSQTLDHCAPESPEPDPRTVVSHQLVLPSYDPEALCIKCGGESIQLAYHPAPVPGFNGERFPCSAYAFGALSIRLGEHLCKRCSTCGFSWMEEVAEAGPDYSVVELPESELYPELEQGGDMAIRKYGAATGEVTGIDQDTASLVKEGAARPEWDDQDERALARENDDADKDE